MQQCRLCHPHPGLQDRQEPRDGRVPEEDRALRRQALLLQRQERQVQAAQPDGELCRAPVQTDCQRPGDHNHYEDDCGINVDDDDNLYDDDYDINVDNDNLNDDHDINVDDDNDQVFPKIESGFMDSEPLIREKTVIATVRF